MIIQIRGTSGSGKTWVMRQVMAQLELTPEYMPGRKKPACYISPERIVVLGHYESNCGGCDNVGSAGEVFKLIQYVSKTYHPVKHILCEGLLLSEDTKWSMQLEDLRVIFLTTPIDKCVDQIKKRRETAGNTKELNEKNTRNRESTIERGRKKLLDAGIECVRCPASQAIAKILNWLERW